jgi:hypothetical protein
MATKEEIRPIYAELRGRLLEAPNDKQSPLTNDSSLWEHHNQLVDELIQVTQGAYSKYRIAPRGPDELYYHPYVHIATYRSMLSGLVGRLHADFFSDEPSPFAGTPGMIISQTQQQSQTVHIQMIMEIQEQLIRSETRFTEGSKERGFIDKAKRFLKSAASGVTSAAQLMLLLLNVAKECGLSVEDMQRVFGG